MASLSKLSSSRMRRLLFCTLVPPLLGSLSLIVLIIVGSIAENIYLGSRKNDLSEIDFFALVAFLVPFSYVFMGLQALLVALIMEFLVRKYAKRKWQIIASGALLGFLATATIFSKALPMLIIGSLIGSGIGYILSLAFNESTSAGL